MSLRQRLDALRREAGVSAAASAVPQSSLGERLQRLRVGDHPAYPGSRTGPDPEALARAVNGVAVGEGVIRVEHRMPLSAHHGAVPLGLLGENVIRPEPGVEAIEPRRLLFFDTETSGLAGGTGTIAFMLGLGRVVEGEFVTRQYLLTGFGGEPAMLDAFARECEGVEALVSFNGKSFDATLLRDRCRLNRRASPVEALHHWDLLHPVRRLFLRRWPDCRLATAERHLLGFRRVDDMPGSEAPTTWFDYVHQGRVDRMPHVLKHNHSDLLSLAALLPALMNAHETPASAGADIPAVARAWRLSGAEDRARTLLAVHERDLDEIGLSELARLHRRAGHWGEAVRIWQGLADGGFDRAREELAKYHEHVARDWEAADRCAAALPGSEAVARRRRRLRSKIERAARQLPLPVTPR